MSLTVRRMNLTLEAPSGDGERQARQALDAMPRTAPQALARRLAPLCPPEDTRVVIIPRLRFTIDLDGEVTADAMAEQVAQAVEAGLAEALARDAGAVQYRNPAALLADWLSARLAGRVAHHGRFRRFRGLEYLPPGQALRTYLGRTPETAWLELAEIAPEVLARLWPVLEDGDAASILDMATSLPLGAAEAADWTVMAEALAAKPALSAPVAAVAAAVETMATLGRSERWIADAALPAAQYMTAIHRRNAKSRAGPTANNSPTDRRTTDQSDLAAKGVPESLAHALTTQRRTPAHPQKAVPVQIDTPYAGYAIFLAFDQVAALAEVARDITPPSHAVHSGNALTLCLLRALAGEDGSALLCDPGWRMLLEIPEHIPEPDLIEWAAAQDAAWSELAHGSETALTALCAEMFEDLAKRLPGFGKAGAGFLRNNILMAGGRIDTSSNPLRIALTRPPLDIVLAMSGLADREVLLPDGRVAVVERLR